jgi:hypothetical protein
MPVAVIIIARLLIEHRTDEHDLALGLRGDGARRDGNGLALADERQVCRTYRELHTGAPEIGDHEQLGFELVASHRDPQFDLAFDDTAGYRRANFLTSQRRLWLVG